MLEIGAPPLCRISWQSTKKFPTLAKFFSMQKKGGDGAVPKLNMVNFQSMSIYISVSVFSLITSFK